MPGFGCWHGSEQSEARANMALAPGICEEYVACGSVIGICAALAICVVICTTGDSVEEQKLLEVHAMDN